MAEQEKSPTPWDSAGLEQCGVGTHIIPPCAPGRRCGRWRTCDACARIRQAQIAAIAEKGATHSPHITYAVVRPCDQRTLAATRAALIDRLARVSDGGVWTVETADHAGLHLNIVAGARTPLHAADIARSCPPASPADVWAAPVPHRDVRHVAAYIAKRRAIPDRTEYAGRVYGAWGRWKSPLAALVEDRTAPAILAAVALESMLEGAGVPHPDTRPDRSIADLARMRAIRAGALTLHGYRYIAGQGVAAAPEARALRS